MKLPIFLFLKNTVFLIVKTLSVLYELEEIIITNKIIGGMRKKNHVLINIFAFD